MTFAGFCFLFWRFCEIITLVPVVGMLGWFVARFTDANELTPNYVLVLFVVAVLALAWAIFTLLFYLRARHDALFLALVDLAFLGALIAGVVVLRRIASANCANFGASFSLSSFVPVGAFYFHLDKTCSMLKASFALAIINIFAFLFSSISAFGLYRFHRDEDRVVVRREYHSSSRHGRGHSHGHHRSSSRGVRSSRDYDYGYDRPRSGGRRSSTHRSSSRRQYYV